MFFKPNGRFKKKELNMPKIVDHNQKRSQIARAVIMLFAQKGFENTSMKDIAESTGIAKSTLYHYFDNKEAILKEASLEILTEHENAVSESFRNQSHPSDKIRVLFKEVLSLSPEAERIFLIFMELWLSHMRGKQYGRFMDIFRELLQGFRTTVQEIIIEGQSRGIYRQDLDAEAIAVYLVASLDGIYMHYYFDQHDFDLFATTKAFIETFIKGLTIRQDGP